MTAQGDLFGRPLLSGLAMRDEIVTTGEEQALIRHIDDLALEPFKFQGWLGKRLTRSFGWSYDFQHGRLAEADAMPHWLTDVRRRAAAFAGLGEAELVQALLIRYDPGAGIGWHKDRPVFEHVVGISLGHAATLRLRRRLEKGFERRGVPLPPRSIYHLSGEVRHRWEHSIAPMAVPRWSITFRSLAATQF